MIPGLDYMHLLHSFIILRNIVCSPNVTLSCALNVRAFALPILRWSVLSQARACLLHQWNLQRRAGAVHTKFRRGPRTIKPDAQDLPTSHAFFPLSGVVGRFAPLVIIESVGRLHPEYD